MNASVPASSAMEIVEYAELSPLVDKCVIKVCYVGDNRNGTSLSKDVCTEMGRKILGSPIVGFFDETTQDFGGHDRDIRLVGNGFKVVDITRPYGFVPTDSKVWFQKFIDNGVEHEYLCVEGVLWTKAYSEAQRILTNGNNQSMELNKDFSTGSWAKSLKSGDSVFIYNEALVEKLCILGENVEPCFEGAQIRSNFSLQGEGFEIFKATMFALIDVLKGGSKEAMENKENVPVQAVEPIYVKKEDEEKPETKEEKGEEKETPSQEKEKEKEEEKKKYNLAEVVEYQELKVQNEELQGKYAALQKLYSGLQDQVTELTKFKNEADREKKLAMVDKFYMLNDEDKKEIVDNLDTYSIDDVEARLSVICFRKGLGFEKPEETKMETPAPTTYSLADAVGANSGNNGDVPAWIQAAMSME